MHHVLTPVPPGVPTHLHPHYGVAVYSHPATHPSDLPASVVPCTPPSHSAQLWIQHDINGTKPLQTPPPDTLEPYLWQTRIIDAITAAERDGHPGYLLALPTGSGKTPIQVGVANILKPDTVLAVTTANRLESYKNDIDRWAQPGSQWVVVNPEKFHTLHHASVTPRTPHPRWGEPLIRAQMTVMDEAHHFTNPGSHRSLRAAKLTEGSFTIHSSATPFSDLKQTYYVAPLLASALGVQPPQGDYRSWLERHKIIGQQRTGVPGATGNMHDIRFLLFERGIGTPLNETDIPVSDTCAEVHPIYLTARESREYNASWTEFCDRHRLSNMFDDPVGPVATALRQVQKASYIKMPHISRMVADLVSQGNQVVVTQWYQATARALSEHVRQELQRRAPRGHDPVCVLSGDTPEGERESIRRDFQTGRRRVLVTSALESINLHSGEREVEPGVHATVRERVLVVADPLTGGKRQLQAEGRINRDGSVGRVLFVYADGTRDQDWYHNQFVSTAATLELASRVEGVSDGLRQRYLSCAEGRRELSDRVGTSG